MKASHLVEKSEFLKIQKDMEAKAKKDALEIERQKSRGDYTTAVNCLSRAITPMMQLYLSDIAPNSHDATLPL
jgi:hypothetical protein